MTSNSTLLLPALAGLPAAPFLPVALAVACLAGCGTPTETAPDESPRPETPRVEVPPVDLSDWGAERIELPPGFAPELPAGEEVLLFAPGMFDGQSEELWSYAFLVRLEAAAPDRAGLAEFLELYYDGLLRAVGEGNGTPVGDDPASVELRAAGNGRFLADVALIDAFATGEALDLRMDIEVVERGPGASLLRIKASPRPEGHPIWVELEAALASLEL